MRPIALAAALLPLPVFFVQTPTREKPQLIRDVRLFDGDRVREHRSVLVENGTITRIGGPMLEAGGADAIDGRGLTLMPGLIDAHVHFADQAEPAARQALRLGVTMQLDMFSAGERLERLKKLRFEDRADVAAVRTAGIGATVAGGIRRRWAAASPSRPSPRL